MMKQKKVKYYQHAPALLVRRDVVEGMVESGLIYAEEADYIEAALNQG